MHCHYMAISQKKGKNSCHISVIYTENTELWKTEDILHNSFVSESLKCLGMREWGSETLNTVVMMYKNVVGCRKRRNETFKCTELQKRGQHFLLWLVWSEMIRPGLKLAAELWNSITNIQHASECFYSSTRFFFTLTSTDVLTFTLLVTSSRQGTDAFKIISRVCLQEIKVEFSLISSRPA